MNRRDRYRAVAEENLEIFRSGGYTTPDGEWCGLEPDLSLSRQETIIVEPDRAVPAGLYDTEITIGDEDTLQGLDSLQQAGVANPAVLNFASARTPGGGFLRGGTAQEESLCRATTLYHALETQEAYYARNKASIDTCYADIGLYTPKVRQIRDDHGSVQPASNLFSVITVAAPNRRAAREQGVERLKSDAFDRCLEDRVALILQIAASKGHDCVLLGAWGCGVFGNDPDRVARTFVRSLDGRFAGSFRRVHFAVPSRFDQACFDAFSSVIPGH
ncbi:TIGR02452 family protein [Maricaulis sp.]|uniref:TIGR02452 family protein n=1 Tax=Maricaulis sp. TaxID=1486257 RepID=UPI0026171476|nr:TIGR02452 family protein [Maricaulis sp.]